MRVRRLTAVIISVVLMAACSAGSTPRRVGTTTSIAASTGTTASPTATSLPSIRYRVKRGDSLINIANQFREPLIAIVRHNHIANPDHLAEGQILVITPFSSVTLTVTPPRGEPGQAFHLELSGATPAETITFEIDSPAGKYTGAPHAASATGTVAATYQPAASDPTGIYRITANGNLGTTVQAGFRLVAPATEPG
jgi:LysM repeat protein